MLEPLYLTNTSYQGRSKIASSQRLYNMYSENTLQSSPFQAPSLFNIPGSTEWKSISGNYNPYYGSVVMNNKLYVVFGVTLYQIDTNKNVTEIGTLGTSAGRVIMVENGLQVGILTSAGIVYYYTESSDTFGQVTLPNSIIASGITSTDGYVMVSERETGKFYVSELRDITTWSALAQATAEALSDNIIALATYQRQFFILGEKSIEVWYNSGVSAQPFRPIQQTYIPEGCIGRTAYTVSSSGLFWINENKSAFWAQSLQAKKISTFGIDYKLSQLTYPENIIASSYTQDGHEFIVFTSKQDGITLVYDLSTDSWHDRGSLNSTENGQTYWGATDAIRFANKILVPGINNGTLYYLDQSVYTEGGRTMTSEIVSATIFDNFNRFTINQITLVMENGVGLPSGQGSDPLIEMSFSIDGGKTWKTSRATFIGKEGEFLTQVKWENLGQGRSFIVKFRITDPVPRSIIGAFFQRTKGGV